jgi:hypothetical protein
MQRAMAFADARDAERHLMQSWAAETGLRAAKLFDKSRDGEHGSIMFVFHRKLIGCLARIRTRKRFTSHGFDVL